MCELGDGCFDSLLDPDVQRLARRLYSLVDSLSPSQVYEAVLEGRIPQGKPPVDIIGGGIENDWRFQSAKVSHLSVTLVQYLMDIECESVSVGHAKHTFIFKDKKQAQLAVAVDRTSRIATSSDVMRCLSRSLDTPLMSEILWRGNAIPSLKIHKQIKSMDDDLIRASTQCCNELLDQSKAVGETTRLWAYLSSISCAVLVTVCHWQWHSPEAGVLVHKNVKGAVLRVHCGPMSIGGLLELHLDESTDEWPWWIDRTARRVDSVVINTTTVELPQPSRKRRKEDNVVFPRTDDDSLAKPVKKVVDKWSRSSNAPGLVTSNLISSIPNELEGCNFSDLTAHRRRTKEELSSIVDVFSECFSKSYAQEATEHVLNDPHLAAFEIRNMAGCVVGAVTVILFESEGFDGRPSLSMLVDTFGVLKAHRGQRIGRKIFHDLCRKEICESKTAMYYILAQCVKKGDAGDFWAEKLDPSSESRDVMLQAYRLGHVSVQNESVCEVRGRWYRR